MIPHRNDVEKRSVRPGWRPNGPEAKIQIWLTPCCGTSKNPGTRRRNMAGSSRTSTMPKSGALNDVRPTWSDSSLSSRPKLGSPWSGRPLPSVPSASGPGYPSSPGPMPSEPLSSRSAFQSQSSSPSQRSAGGP